MSFFLDRVRPQKLDLNDRGAFQALAKSGLKEQWDFGEFSESLPKGALPFVFSEEHLSTFSEIEDMRPVEREDMVREISANFLDLLLFGENLAHALSGQLILLLPWQSARNAVTMQVMDEARHIEALNFLKNDCLKFSRDTFLTSPNSNCNEVLESTSWVEKVVALQLISENAAVAILRFLITSTRQESIRALLIKILGDESRHNFFGRVALGSDEVISEYGSKAKLEEHILSSIEDMIYKEKSMMQQLGFCIKKHSSFPTLPFFLARVKSDMSLAGLMSAPTQLKFSDWERELNLRGKGNALTAGL